MTCLAVVVLWAFASPSQPILLKVLFLSDALINHMSIFLEQVRLMISKDVLQKHKASTPWTKMASSLPCTQTVSWVDQVSYYMHYKAHNVTGEPIRPNSSLGNPGAAFHFPHLPLYFSFATWWQNYQRITSTTSKYRKLKKSGVFLKYECGVGRSLFNLVYDDLLAHSHASRI